MNFDGTYPNGGLENGGTINGDLLIDADAHITGDLLVDGTVTAEAIVVVDEIKVSDAIILMGHNNVADTFNMGILEEYTNAGIQHSGLLRSAVDKKQYLIENISPIPTISTDLTLLNRGNLVVNGLESTTTTTDTVNFNQSDTGTVDWNVETDGNGLIFTPSSDIGQLRLGASGFTFGYRASDGQGGYGMVINRSRGTITAPTAVVSGDSLNEDYAAGYDGVSYETGSVIKTIASENFTPTNQGAAVVFSTTDIATTTPTEKLRLDTSGVTISNAYTLPDDSGNSGDVLVSDGLGNSEWEAQGDITSSTGVLSGGILSITTPGVSTTFNISSGTGQFIVGSTVIPTSWADFVEITLTPYTPLTYISLSQPLTPGGVPVVNGRSPPLTAHQSREEIIIGVVSSVDTLTLLGYNASPLYLGNNMNQFRDLCMSLGILNTSGNIMGPSILLTVSKTIGTIFELGGNYSIDVLNPNISTIPAFDTNGADTYFLSYQTNDIAVHSDIRPAEYDTGAGIGSPGVVGVNKWTNMRCYVATNRLIISAGQFVYNSEVEAQSALFSEQHIVAPDLGDVSVLIGFMVMRGGASDLNNTSDCVFIKATSGGGSSSGGQIFDQDLNTSSDVQFASVKTESVNFEGAAEPISNFETGEWDFSNNTPGVTEISASSCTFNEIPGKRAISSLYGFKPGDLGVNGYMEVKCTLTSISLNKWVGFGFSFPSCETSYLGHEVGYGDSENYLLANGLDSGASNLMIGDGIVIHDPVTPTILVGNGDKVSVRLTRTSSTVWTLSYKLGPVPTAILATTLLGPEFEWLNCHTYSGVFSESSNVGYNVASPVISHSLWTPSATNIIEQMDNSNHLEIVGPGSTSLTDTMLTFTPQALEIKNNLQADGRITSQKSLFGFPTASNVCFYVSTTGVDYKADLGQVFQMHLGQRQFGDPDLPKFNQGSYVKISMQGTYSVNTGANTAELLMRIYIGAVLVGSNSVGDSKLSGPISTRDWDLQVSLYPRTFSVVDFESINIYCSGKWSTHKTSGGSFDNRQGWAITTANNNVTPAQLGDVRVEFEWQNTVSALDIITMQTCSYEYGGFNT